VAALIVVLISLAAAGKGKRTKGTKACDRCRRYCEKMKKKTKMQDLILCDNEGVTWKNNCDFIHTQCLRLAEGKMLMVTGEGYCSAPVDEVGSVDGVGGVATVGRIDAINATLTPVGDIDGVDDIRVTVGPMDAVGDLDSVNQIDDVVSVDAVPTIPNKRPPIPTPKQPDHPKSLDTHPATMNPRLDGNGRKEVRLNKKND